MNKEIKLEAARSWAKDFRADETKRFIRNAVERSEIRPLVINHDVVNETQLVFSTDVRGGDIMAQKKTGRCWIFAALNVLREKAIREHDLKQDFAFSPVYLYFWDKLEKSNFFLEEVIEDGDEYLRSPANFMRLMYPAGESGQWFMFRNLVRKYGLVPMEVMPETHHSLDSQEMNRYLGHILRTEASRLAKAMKTESPEQLRARKEACLRKVHDFLCSTLGTPPERFCYDYYDKDGGFHHIADMSPAEFNSEFGSDDLDGYVCLANAPGRDRPYHQTFTLEHFGNMAGGDSSLYYNLPMDEITPILLRQLEDGEGIWFGCDCMNMMDRYEGIMNERLYDHDALFGVEPLTDKADLLDYWESSPNHNMVIAGVKESGDGRRYWKVENSWGSDVGQHGYYIMSEGYLNLYASEFIVRKEYLNEKQLRELEMEPVVLPATDPLGA